MADFALLNPVCIGLDDRILNTYAANNTSQDMKALNACFSAVFQAKDTRDVKSVADGGDAAECDGDCSHFEEGGVR